MEPSCFESPQWYQALTLKERISSLHGQPVAPPIGANGQLTNGRIDRWRSQPPFTTDTYFAQRLAMYGITEDEFQYLLEEPIEALHSRISGTPEWLSQLAEAFGSPSPPNSRSVFSEPKLHGQELTGFLVAIAPLLNWGRDRLRRGVQQIIKMRSYPPFDRETIEDLLLANLPSRLLWMLNRTMVLELNVARLEKLLHGETAEERFQSFIQILRQREKARAILQEYPVLARQLTTSIDRWITFSLEFLQHLCADWEQIQAAFLLERDLGVLTSVNAMAGDSHRDGRSVVIAAFSSGFQLVYKPRPMKLDVHFQDLLTWLNDRGSHPPFRTLRILDRGSYGWVEFVVAEDCSCVAEISRFYERQGAYLALLYAMEATDFHFENVVAAGEHPVLLDLEALFHPRVGRADVKQADELAVSTFNYSVLRVGLLPHKMWSNAEADGVDVSGLGAEKGRLTPFGVPQWEGVGTDEMRFIRKRAPMRGHKNRPTLNGADVDVLDYVEAIADGFTRLYGVLRKHRDALLSNDGPLTRFAQDEVRIILRQTLTYGLLLTESFHPDVLRDALERDQLFDRLWAQGEHRPYLAQVIPAEVVDLQKGDIPIFTTHPDSRDLWTSCGERIADFCKESGLALVRHRFEQLSEDDLAKQRWFIRASLATLSTGINRTRQPTQPLSEIALIADRERLIEAARAIGDRLEVLALRGENDATWIGLTFTAETRWSLVSLGSDLYNGIPGVALFLAHLGAITREERYSTLARSALVSMQRQIGQERSRTTSIGGFDGWGGVIYTLVHLGALWNKPELFTEAEAIVERLPNLIEQDVVLDLIGGAAGCIGTLISLYCVAPSDHTLAAAIQCGDRLLIRAVPMKHGIGWVKPSLAEKPLTGFSHGVAGIAWALLELAQLTGHERFRIAALAGIEYERSLFSVEAGNWPDLREFEDLGQVGNDGENRFMTTWCHGAPGIGLARVCMLRHEDDEDMRWEIEAALKTTVNKAFGGNHSLCHGDLGNLELLLHARETLPDPQYDIHLNWIAAGILDSIASNGWHCATPLSVESPGLMIGLAGIGYGLLRLAEPARVPSVLVLAPPKSSSSRQAVSPFLLESDRKLL